MSLRFQAVVLALFAVTLVAAISYYLVERPFYRLKTYRQVQQSS